MQNKIFLKHEFKCALPELFRWLSQPELIIKWFGPKDFKVRSVQADVRTGGKYQIELVKPHNKSFYIAGEYLEVSNPSKLVFTFIYQGLTTIPPPSVVTIKLEALNSNESMLYLSQEFKWIPPDIDHRSNSWNFMFNALAKAVSMD
jgi:uncharacterized protein YndB with AHSA1/START domain